MQVIALYRPDTEQERPVLDFKRDFEGRSAHVVELQSLNTVEGDKLAGLYDIVDYPAIVVLDNSGVLQKHWQGLPLPLFDDVSAAAQESF